MNDTTGPNRGRQIALHQIRQLMDFWRIAPEELLVEPEVPVVAALPQPVKYRHPLSGETWDGIGEQPPWLRQALTTEGYRVAELRVDVAGAGLSS